MHGNRNSLGIVIGKRLRCYQSAALQEHKNGHADGAEKQIFFQCCLPFLSLFKESNINSFVIVSNGVTGAQIVEILVWRPDKE